MFYLVWIKGADMGPNPSISPERKITSGQEISSTAEQKIPPVKIPVEETQQDIVVNPVTPNISSKIKEPSVITSAEPSVQDQKPASKVISSEILDRDTTSVTIADDLAEQINNLPETLNTQN